MNVVSLNTPIPTATDLINLIHSATGPGNTHTADTVIQAIYLQTCRYLQHCNGGGDHENDGNMQDLQSEECDADVGHRARVLSLP